ncbi:hypothetical protein [Paenibacillus sonchi]|uniref:hypothetical protein n=1 Tax=Paenibacillus sonchi TaxID=373687 RepID=UPI001E2CD48A|nr:hypothetical protein [Paenibacillus sonchi]MCE3203449.1 hypothetical protein [Paenibacillus sonchi]
MGKYDHLKKGYREAVSILREVPGVAEYADSAEVAIGRMITERRTELGYDLQQLADVSGVSFADVCVIEMGLTHHRAGLVVTPDALSKLFKALQIEGLRPMADEEAAAYAANEA